jgi:hypothetical protein
MTFNQQTQSNYGPPPFQLRYKKPKRILKEPFLPVVPATIKGQMYMHVKAFDTWFKTTIYLVT